jgi:hypothetical protein
VNDLRKTELGQTLTALEGAVDAGEAMLYNANGLFSSIATTFTAPNDRRSRDWRPLLVRPQECGSNMETFGLGEIRSTSKIKIMSKIMRRAQEFILLFTSPPHPR